MGAGIVSPEWHGSCSRIRIELVLSIQKLQVGLPAGRMGVELHYYATIGSTNDRAAELARDGAPEGTLVVADEQTAGRGRAGRKWHTPAGSGLALSLILRPRGLDSSVVRALGLIGAMGIIDALSEFGLQAELKWPNDVLLQGGKVAGVLAEASWTGPRLDHVILGIGVNVKSAGLPSLAFPATSIESSRGQTVSREALLVGVLAGTDRWYGRLLAGEAHPAWEARLAYRGQRVAITNGTGEHEGRVLGLTREAGLRLEGTGGEEVVLEAGAYQLRPLVPV